MALPSACLYALGLPLEQRDHSLERRRRDGCGPDMTIEQLNVPDAALALVKGGPHAALDCNGLLNYLPRTDAFPSAPAEACAMSYDDFVGAARSLPPLASWTPPSTASFLHDVCPVECGQHGVGPCAADDAEADAPNEADDGGGFDPFAHHGDDELTCVDASGHSYTDRRGDELDLPEPVIAGLVATKVHGNCDAMLGLLSLYDRTLDTDVKICSLTKKQMVERAHKNPLMRSWTPPHDIGGHFYDSCPVECAKVGVGPCADVVGHGATGAQTPPVPFAGLWTFGFL